MDSVLLTPKEMASADRATIDAGTPGIVLMERAGAAVAAAVRRRLPKGGGVIVLAGPGNNGGDGFVAARLLRRDGYRVTAALYGDRARIVADAKLAIDRYGGPLVAADPTEFAGADLIVDALFGAGLHLPLAPAALALIRAANDSGIPVLAVDLPSGIDGAGGMNAEAAIIAAETVTFFRLKPAHVLLPGRINCGTVTLVDIGISPSAISRAALKTRLNRPDLWLDQLPRPRVDGHKYDRGHLLVIAGAPGMGGAARLAAGAALRMGAGLVTIGAPAASLAENAAQLNAIMLRQVDSSVDLVRLLGDRRINSIVLGPGLGAEESTARLVEGVILAATPAVLDADALSAFARQPARLIDRLDRSAGTVLTPHAGEFARLFPEYDGLSVSKLEKARKAAQRCRAVIVLKGADTVVAAPDGLAAIADNAPPSLATAGAGDVLAGMIGGLMAEGMPAFQAATAAVWVHGEAAKAAGIGLTAEDLAPRIPAVLARLLQQTA